MTKPNTPPVSPEDLAALSKMHAECTARYDATAHLASAMTLANAGFARALLSATSGQPEAAQAVLTTSAAMLEISMGLWRAVDAGSPFEAADHAAAIARLRPPE